MYTLLCMYALYMYMYIYEQVSIKEFSAYYIHVTAICTYITTCKSDELHVL